MTPDQLQLLTRSYLLPSVPGRTLVRTLEICGDKRFGSQELIPYVIANPGYSHSILKQRILAEKISEWTEEDPERADLAAFLTKRVVTLLGKTAVRNLIASFRLARVTNPGLARKKGDSLDLQPQSQIPSAIRTEEYCIEEKWAYPEVAFIGGLHYDWLSALLAFRKAGEDAKKTLKDAYAEGSLTAQYAHKISQQMSGIKHDHFVFAAALVLPLGRALMAAIFPKGGVGPSWSTVMANCEKSGFVRADARDFFEKKNFNVTYPEMTALYVGAFSMLDSVSPAIRYALEPWMLLAGDRDQYQLAMILSIATTLARAGQLSPGAKLPLRGFQLKWLKQSRINEDALRKALAAVKVPGK